jgi:hypothetical protein
VTNPKSSAVLATLLLVSCHEPTQCRYQLGDKVKILTGDSYVVMERWPGYGGAEPTYRLMTSVGWRVEVARSTEANPHLGGLKLTRGEFMAKESQIAGYDEEAKK